MNRRSLVSLSMAALAACSAGDNTGPDSLPTFKISDGAHRQAFNDPNGNVDFFFLPPMVPNPSGNPNFNAGDFNPNLLPTVEVCALDLPDNAPGSAVLLTTPCKTGGYFVSFGAPVNVPLELYQGSWTVPVSSERFYRLFVKVGDAQLGFADVWTVASPSQLKTVNKQQFVGQQDGSALPVKFRIEVGALCDPPGTRPCTSSTLALQTGGSLDLGNDGTSFDLPAQTQSGQHTFTLQKGCPDFNPDYVDLPMFGSCVRIKSNPAFTGVFDNLATVQICDLVPDIPAGMSEEQEARITLHRRDGTTITALEHASGCPLIAATPPSLKGVFRELVKGRLGSAGKQLAALLGPKPLYARRINLGGGGRTPGTSDFQFLLPADMEEVEGNGQTGTLGDLLPVQPKIKVVDLGGECVAGVTVNIVGDGVSQTSQTTTCPGGEVTVPWTPTLWGTNTLTFSGRGVAGNDFNGPRDHLLVPDPFQHFPYGGPPSPESGTDSGPITLLTGSLVFNAYGAEGFETGTANAWTASGFWHKSSVGSSIVNQAFTDGLVSLATLNGGDQSAGAMPNPFAGSNVFWYGTELGASPPVGTENGNYIGTRSGNNANGSLSGGESTTSNSGTLTSPSIVVPANGQLTFQGWFEIESVNPSGPYDFMTVTVVPTVGPPAVLGQLNPGSDPPGGSAPVPFTTAGFDVPPVWVEFTHDLSAYAGQTISLRFDFDTFDELYNGFRGWLVDNVLIAPAPPPSLFSLRAALRAGNAAKVLNPLQPRPPRR